MLFLMVMYYILISYKEKQKHVELVMRDQHSRDQESVLMNINAYDIESDHTR